MAESAKSVPDLRFRNVSLHARGETEHGTIHLTKHHLIFSCYPDAKKSKPATSSAQLEHAKATPKDGPQASSAEGSNVTEASTSSGATVNGVEQPAGQGPSAASVAIDGGAAQPGSVAKRKEHRPKTHPKERWVPLPLINHCTLRPSHALDRVARPPVEVSGSSADLDGEDLFPPNFGTASMERPSSDSARMTPFSSPPRPSSPVAPGLNAALANGSARQPAIRIRCKDFRMMALHFHSDQNGNSPDETARQVFYALRARCCVSKVQDLHAFQFHPPKQEVEAIATSYDARREYARMGISGKAVDGPGTAWRISDINNGYSYSTTYPNVLCVPRTVSDNMLKYGGGFRTKSRIPCLAYLHSNGGSITRSSQPMVGVQSKRNPQDERLVSAIFSSHTPRRQSLADSPPQLPSLTSPSTTTLDSSTSDPATVDSDVPRLPISQSETVLNEHADEDQALPRPKIYGSTRKNLIVDARPRINALANRATGGGIEDVSHYAGTVDTPTERVFLNIANIHVMRSSLEKVVESFANADYLDMKPDQEALRKSGWLGHIAGMLDGTETVVRVVGLGGSHVLVHCSDGWDRTSQVSALAQVMLDPHYRTFDGFVALVQKDFLSFGHKFRDRDGIEGSEKWFEIENERIAPSRGREHNGSDSNSLNVLSTKALTGAKNWFEKNRGSLFRQQNNSRDSVADRSPSRPPSPPPNPLIHSTPTATSKAEKEHKMSEKEIAPIFHQFLDAVYQLMCQYPEIFEFNERFLRRLFYHTYACQYGEFLFNNENERQQNKGKTYSVWSHFLSRRQEFINPEYVAKVDDPLLFPKRQGLDREVKVRWWSELFGRKDEEMNLPGALAPADPPTITPRIGSSVSFDEHASSGDVSVSSTSTSNGVVKESKSTPNLHVPDDINGHTSALSLQSDDANETTAARSVSSKLGVDFQLLEEHTESSEPPSNANGKATEPKVEQLNMWEDGDPLGVTSNTSHQSRGGGLDIAAFASENAFRDR